MGRLKVYYPHLRRNFGSANAARTQHDTQDGPLVAKTRFARDFVLSMRSDAEAAVIPNAVNPAFLGVQPSWVDMTVLWIGTINRNKNLGCALRAFASLAGRSARLVVFGRGPDMAAMKALAAQLGIAARVDFRGHVGRSDILHALARGAVPAADIIR